MRSNLALLSSVLSIGAALASLTSVPVQAASDCPPIGQLRSYKADQEQPQLRDFDSFEFRVKKGDSEETVTVAGRKCVQIYTPKEGASPMSDREIQLNYRDQLRKAGATLLFTDGRNTVGRIEKGGQETWVHVYSQETEIDVTVVNKQPHKQVLTQPSGNDYRLLGHMPNYVAGDPERRNFDEYQFQVKDGDDVREVQVEGAKYFVSYSLKEGVQTNSDLDVQTNYRTALAALGAEILFADGRNTYARFENKGQSIWVRLYSQDNAIEIVVIEEKPFQPSVKPPDVSALKSSLDKEGRVALYVNFDFGKATLKPDAAPIIAQVVKLMKDNPKLKLAVEGHTDNVGSQAYNKNLSGQRAAAVVAALVAQGIAKDRLTSAGFGAEKPLAENNTGEGRAKNRRVELVKS